MSVQHTARTGKTYYLHEQTTKTGKRNCFFSMEPDGQLAGAIPDGYEVYEMANGQVFLRKKAGQIILPEEVALVELALRKHGEPWQFRVEVKKNMITVHEAGDLSGLDRLASEFGRRPLSAAEKVRHASFMAVMRFVLVDKKTRTFVTERFCFRGSVDDWIHIGGPGTLLSQIHQFVKHLGRESIYELF